MSNIAHLVEIIGWVALAITLIAAAAISVVAYFRNQPRLVWWAAGALALALTLAAAFPTSAPYGAGVVVILLGGLTAVFGGSCAAVAALDLAMGRSVRLGTHGGIIVDPPQKNNTPDAVRAPAEVLRGGTTIGMLERIATIGTIITGFPEGLAIIVAVKGVGRFTELDSAEARERFIIGTFASLIWACVCALTIHLVIR